MWNVDTDPTERVNGTNVGKAGGASENELQIRYDDNVDQ